MRHIWVEISHCTTAVPGMHFFTNYVAQWGETIFEGAFQFLPIYSHFNPKGQNFTMDHKNNFTLENIYPQTHVSSFRTHQCGSKN